MAKKEQGSPRHTRRPLSGPRDKTPFSGKEHSRVKRTYASDVDLSFPGLSGDWGVSDRIGVACEYIMMNPHNALNRNLA